MLPEAPAHGTRDGLLKAGWEGGSARTVYGAGAPGSRGWWAQPQGSELQPTEPDHGSPEALGLLQGPEGERTCPLVLEPDWTLGRSSGSGQGGGSAPCDPEEEEEGSLSGSGGAVASSPVSPSWGGTRREEARSLTGWVAPKAGPGALGTPRGLSVKTACPQTPPRAAPYPAVEADGPGGGPAAPPAGHSRPSAPGAGADPSTRPDRPPASQEGRPRGVHRGHRRAAPVTGGARPSGRPGPFSPPGLTSLCLACGQRGHPELLAWSGEALLPSTDGKIETGVLTIDSRPRPGGSGGGKKPCWVQRHPPGHVGLWEAAKAVLRGPGPRGDPAPVRGRASWCRPRRG